MAIAETLRQVGEEAEQMRPTITFPFEFEEGKEGVILEVPISNRLQLLSDLKRYFPALAPIAEQPLPLEKRRQYVGRIVEYLDAVVRITPESQEAYREFLLKEDNTLSFTKGDFVYFYSEGEKISFSRLTADESGAVLLQGFELETGEEDKDFTITTASGLYKDPVQQEITYGSLLHNTPSSFSFIEEVLSELSPGVVKSFNIVNPFDPPVRINRAERDRLNRVLNPMRYPKIRVDNG